MDNNESTKKDLPAILLLLGILVVFAAVYLWMRHDAPAPGESVGAERVSGPAPELAYRTHAGLEQRLSALRGRPVLVHFWATWCPPCRDELPGLLDLAASGEITVLAVSLDGDWDRVRHFLDGEAPAAVVLAAPGTEPERFGVTGFPETYLVDARGQLRQRFSGPRDWRSDAMREAVTTLADDE
jgi:thiol-disulfide isomerase/thioredoxin